MEISPILPQNQPALPQASQGKTVPGNVPAPAAVADQLQASVSKGPEPIRLFFFSDSHSRSHLLNRFIDQANHHRPDLIIDGGDIVHDGTEPEHKRAYAERARLTSPLFMATGNHDMHRRGPFTEPPPYIPPFQSFDFKGVHFILLDNEDETLSEEQFKKLEADLRANRGKTTLVAMHVPVLMNALGWTSTLKKVLPFKLASTTMSDPAQVKRFTDLMSQYKVAAVLTGHSHRGDEVVRDGVRYLTVGATGGLTPGLHIQREYLDIAIAGGQVSVKRIMLEPGYTNLVSFMGETLDFYKDLNSFSHQTLGWKYVPSVSLQYQGGLKLSSTDRGESPAFTAGIAMEREISGKQAWFGTGTAAIGPRELSSQLMVGYKYRVLGDYNRSLYLGAAGGVNGGIIAGQLSAGVGAKVVVGTEYKNLILEAGFEKATNYTAQSFSVGYRF